MHGHNDKIKQQQNYLKNIISTHYYKMSISLNVGLHGLHCKKILHINNDKCIIDYELKKLPSSSAPIPLGTYKSHKCQKTVCTYKENMEFVSNQKW